MLAYARTFAFVSHLPLNEVSYVSVRSEQIANAMLLIVYLLLYVCVYVMFSILISIAKIHLFSDIAEKDG